MRHNEPVEQEDKKDVKKDGKPSAHPVENASSESLKHLEAHNQKEKERLQQEKQDRSPQSLDVSQKRAKIVGSGTGNLKQRPEISDGDKVLVKGLSAADVERALKPENHAETLKELKVASEKGMMIGDGGKPVQVKTEQQITDHASAALKTLLGAGDPHLKIPKVEARAEPKNDPLGQFLHNVESVADNLSHLGKQQPFQTWNSPHQTENVSKAAPEAHKENHEITAISPKTAENAHANEKSHFLNLIKAHVSDKPGDKAHDNKMDSAQEKRMEKNIADFEKRESMMADTFKKSLLSDADWKKEHPGLSKDELEIAAAKEAHAKAEMQMADTYKHLSELVKGTGKSPELLSERQRQDIAEQILSRAAHPELIAQGNHNTCQMACLERRAFFRTPAEATRLITEVALKGEYKSTQSGVDVKISPKQIRGDSENSIDPNDSDNKVVAGDGERSFADHIFVDTAANIALQSEHRRYEHNQIYNNNGPQAGDRTVIPDSNPNLSNFQIALIDSEINCRPGEKPQNGWIFGVGNVSTEKHAAFMTPVYNPKDMADQMVKALDEGKGPLLVNVSVGRDGHDLTVDSYLKVPGSGGHPLFNVDNNYEAARDSKFESPYDLYKRMSFKNEIHGTADGGRKDFHDILQTIDGLANAKLSPADYTEAVISQLSAYNTIRDANGSQTDDVSRKEVAKHLAIIMNKLKPGNKAYDAIHSDGLWHEKF